MFVQPPDHIDLQCDHIGLQRMAEKQPRILLDIGYWCLAWYCSNPIVHFTAAELRSCNVISMPHVSVMSVMVCWFHCYTQQCSF